MEQFAGPPPMRAELASLEQHHGLSEGWALLLHEAARVCFASQHHNQLAVLRVFGDESAVVEIAYQDPTDLIIRNHRDGNTATENGACAVAILLCRLLKGYAVVEQAVQLDGIDYWVGEAEPDRPMSRKARLEASGVRQGGEQAVKQRFRQKLATTAKSDGALPAVIAVVEFSAPLAQMETKP